MSELYMMLTITERSRLTTFLNFYKERELPVQFISLALGTASNETLGYLGLEKSDKCVFMSFVTDEKWEQIRRDLRREIQIDVPGMGIAFTVPLSSIGGKRELMFLTEHQNFQKGEESTMKDTKHELLIVIANHGYSDTIMDAARAAGAAGGTVIHAKGTGMEGAEKFLGITLAAEKEMIYVVVKSSQKNAIMSAIMEKAGMDSKAKAICFTLPVASTAGLRLIEDE
ncbi:MAG: P-II family nitrogen regulator [Oscillospiraceae bacterium]|nr:P-II family nitrogen regulator [Oscillospiraceae bacterium]